MNINTVQQTSQSSSKSAQTNTAKPSDGVSFSEEFKNLSNEKTDKTEKTEETNTESVKTQTDDKQTESEKNDSTKVDVQENSQEDTKVAIDGLEDAVEEISKLNRTEEKKAEELKLKDISDEIKIKQEQKEEANGLIDNNMNIQEPKDRLTSEMNANMSFNSNGQPFSEFINPNSKNQELTNSAKDINEEKAILSTMEENIAIANKNMAMKEKTITDEHGIKKVSTNTNIKVDTIVSFDSVVMDKSDVEFFANLVNGDVMNLSDVKNPEKSASVSKTLADLLVKSIENNKPVRIDFDNNISVIIKISRDGKISADFLPSSQVAEAYLKENLPLLKQRFDDNNIDYEQLNQRKQNQNQNEENNRKKGRKDE